MSPVGALDMAGNVREWCGDYFSATYYNGGAMTNPTGPAAGPNRLNRGGSWYSDHANCRTAHRREEVPTATFSYIGFRLSKS